MSDCSVTNLNIYSCKKCATTTSYGGSCSTVVTNLCTRCVTIDPDIYNAYSGSLYYTGKICMTDSAMQFCSNPDSPYSTCDNYNPGCNGCCLRVNANQNICIKESIDTNDVCPLDFGSDSDYLEVNSTVEEYSAFTLSVALVSFILICTFITTYVYRRNVIPSWLPTEKTELTKYTAIASSFLVLLLIIQLSLCSAYYCSQLNEAAVCFIIFCLCALAVLSIELQWGLVSHLLVKYPKVNPTEKTGKSDDTPTAPQPTPTTALHAANKTYPCPNTSTEILPSPSTQHIGPGSGNNMAALPSGMVHPTSMGQPQQSYMYVPVQQMYGQPLQLSYGQNQSLHPAYAQQQPTQFTWQPAGAQPTPGSHPVSGAQPTPGSYPVSGAQPTPGSYPVSGAQPIPGSYPVSAAQPIPGSYPVSGAQPTPGSHPVSGAQPASGSQSVLPSGGSRDDLTLESA